MPDLTPKSVRLSPTGTFLDQILLHLPRQAQLLESNLKKKKIPDLCYIAVVPAYFRAISDIPGHQSKSPVTSASSFT